MAKLILMHKEGSIYDDDPESVYDFPKAYLKAIESGVGDWASYYEPVKSGARGYFAVAQIERIIPKPGVPDRFLALVAPGTFLPFDRAVPRLYEGRPLEQALTAANGTPAQGGAKQLAVRRLPEADLARIVSLGLPQNLEDVEAVRYDPHAAQFDAPPEAFQRPVIERLTRRAYRDVVFRRVVRDAYGYRCAISGLLLRNGGGRPEVEAARIRPVERLGNDAVQNGLALSGTLHWMFDRGLIAVADDLTILVSGNKVPAEVVQRLIVPDRRLRVPADARHHPHPANLRWHREHVFGQGADGPAPWR